MVDNANLYGFFRTLEGLPSVAFSTADFIVEYRSSWPDEWADLEMKYGVGGKGAGQYYTVSNRVAQLLKKMVTEGKLGQLDYRPAPDGWGNAVIQYWTKTVSPNAEENTSPIDDEYREGAIKLKTHLYRERAWRLAANKKERFKEQHGKLFCENCFLDPVELYGENYGLSVIEVHHAVTAVRDMAKGHRTKLEDLQCLCANCHRLIHAEFNKGGIAS